MAGKTRLDLERLRELHGQGAHPADIAKDLGCSPDAVIDQLHRLGLEWKRRPRGTHKLTEDQRREIIDRYLAGDGATTIARDYSVTKGAIYGILNKAGVGTRSVSGRVSGKCRVVQKNAFRAKGLGSGTRDVPLDAGLRHDAFEEWSEESMYWIGMLMSDGNIHQAAYGQPTISIRLQRADRHHLEALKGWLGTNRAIVDGEHEAWGKIRHTSNLPWCSRRHATLLRELGIRPHKEGRFVGPRLVSCAAFWRGMVDGDGSISSTFYLCAMSRQIIEAWKSWCEGQGSQVTISTREDGLHIGSVRQPWRPVLEALYLGASVCLPRKGRRAAKHFA